MVKFSSDIPHESVQLPKDVSATQDTKSSEISTQDSKVQSVGVNLFQAMDVESQSLCENMASNSPTEWDGLQKDLTEVMSWVSEHQKQLSKEMKKSGLPEMHVKKDHMLDLEGNSLKFDVTLNQGGEAKVHLTVNSGKGKKQVDVGFSAKDGKLITKERPVVAQQRLGKKSIEKSLEENKSQLMKDLSLKDEKEWKRFKSKLKPISKWARKHQGFYLEELKKQGENTFHVKKSDMANEKNKVPEYGVTFGLGGEVYVRVQEKLGKGGQKTVYKALNLNTGELVARSVEDTDFQGAKKSEQHNKKFYQDFAKSSHVISGDTVTRYSSQKPGTEKVSTYTELMTGGEVKNLIPVALENQSFIEYLQSEEGKDLQEYLKKQVSKGGDSSDWKATLEQWNEGRFVSGIRHKTHAELVHAKTGEPLEDNLFAKLMLSATYQRFGKIIDQAVNDPKKSKQLFDFVNNSIDGKPHKLILHEGASNLDRFQALYDGGLGLQEMHEKGWRHNDVKPENYFYKRSEDGEVRAVVADPDATQNLEELNDSKTWLDFELPAYTANFASPENFFNIENSKASFLENKKLGLKEWCPRAYEMAEKNPKSFLQSGDVFAHGIGIYQACTGKKTAPHLDPEVIGREKYDLVFGADAHVTRFTGSLTENEWNQYFPEPEDKNSMLHLAWKCMRRSPADRPQMAEVNKRLGKHLNTLKLKSEGRAKDHVNIAKNILSDIKKESQSSLSKRSWEEISSKQRENQGQKVALKTLRSFGLKSKQYRRQKKIIAENRKALRSRVKELKGNRDLQRAKTLSKLEPESLKNTSPEELQSIFRKREFLLNQLSSHRSKVFKTDQGKKEYKDVKNNLRRDLEEIQSSISERFVTLNDSIIQLKKDIKVIKDKIDGQEDNLINQQDLSRLKERVLTLRKEVVNRLDMVNREEQLSRTAKNKKNSKLEALNWESLKGELLDLNTDCVSYNFKVNLQQLNLLVKDMENQKLAYDNLNQSRGRYRFKSRNQSYFGVTGKSSKSQSAALHLVHQLRRGIQHQEKYKKKGEKVNVDDLKSTLQSLEKSEWFKGVCKQSRDVRLNIEALRAYCDLELLEKLGGQS